jgi:hypothetical protein
MIFIFISYFILIYFFINSIFTYNILKEYHKDPKDISKHDYLIMITIAMFFGWYFYVRHLIRKLIN